VGKNKKQITFGIIQKKSLKYISNSKNILTLSPRHVTDKKIIFPYGNSYTNYLPIQKAKN